MSNYPSPVLAKLRDLMSETEQRRLRLLQAAPDKPVLCAWLSGRIDVLRGTKILLEARGFPDMDPAALADGQAAGAEASKAPTGAWDSTVDKISGQLSSADIYARRRRERSGPGEAVVSFTERMFYPAGDSRPRPGPAVE
ncbi:MAG TPA: hypothetical protein VM074_07135 [Solimonas sp.]|nr:hypothetical protein [Solimonas sp.]